MRRSSRPPGSTRVGLQGCHDLYPGQASAGMQRRAAIARAFAFGPTMLLMDEPFVSLDEKAASELRSLFAALWKAERVTTLFVTHDLAEAAAPATRVLIYSASPATIAADIAMPAGRAGRRWRSGGGADVAFGASACGKCGPNHQ